MAANHTADSRSQPDISCWFCQQPFTTSRIQRDGILRSRRDRLGGPYWIIICPHCTRENLCERTLRGRWFLSPNLRVSLLEYFFSQILDTRPEDFLTAAAWMKDHEDRRRYFFERDGDRRYSGRWLFKLLPLPNTGITTEIPSATRAQTKERTSRPEPPPPDGDESRSSSTGPSGEKTRASEKRTPQFLTPHEILGISRDATHEEIRSAFRRLAKQYHPDKVYHLGDEVHAMAHEKFRRLKEAYDALVEREDAQQNDDRTAAPDETT